MLVLLLGHCTTQKRGYKRDTVGPAGSGGFKVVLALLTKTAVVQVEILIIEVGEPSLEQLLSKLRLD